MKKLITICLITLFIYSCSVRIEDLPDCWEYSPGKWVAFKETIELVWSYNKSGIDKFETERGKVKLKNDDIREIIKLIRKKNIDGLIEKEDSLRIKIKPDEKIKNYKPVKDRIYRDRNEPIPTFGEICFYKIRAVKNGIRSHPAELSVIYLDRLTIEK